MAAGSVIVSGSAVSMPVAVAAKLKPTPYLAVVARGVTGGSYPELKRGVFFYATSSNDPCHTLSFLRIGTRRSSDNTIAGSALRCVPMPRLYSLPIEKRFTVNARAA